MRHISLPEVITHTGITLRKVPLFPNTYAGSNGDIYLLNFHGEVIKTVKVKWRTTKGYYIYASILTDSFRFVKKPIHRLVALAFHGMPENINTYEPNHIDGDKLNNRPDNLEWMTHKQNIQDAYDSGLCTQGLRVEAYNNETGEALKYNSLSKMARDWDIPRHQLRDIISSYRDTSYNGWTFVIDDSKDKKITRHQAVPVIFRDYTTGDVTIVEDYTKASELTNVKASTIAYRVKSNNYCLLSKYVFKRLDDLTVWPEYTEDEAIASDVTYRRPKTDSRDLISNATC
jgi:hypothetical protein